MKLNITDVCGLDIEDNLSGYMDTYISWEIKTNYEHIWTYISLDYERELPHESRGYLFWDTYVSFPTDILSVNLENIINNNYAKLIWDQMEYIDR